jgi:hypothetical protein
MDVAMKPLSKLAVASILAVSFTTTFAGQADAPPPPKDPWLITSDAYLWAMNMKGHTTVDGQRATIHQTFKDTLQQMKLGGMLWVNVSKGRFGMFFNGMFAALRTKKTVDDIEIKASNTFVILSGGFSYAAYVKTLKQSKLGIISSFSVIPYAGVRSTINNVHIKIPGSKFSSDQRFTQPIGGSRFIYQFRKNWYLTFAGDVGYGGHSNKSYNLIGLLGYNNLFGLPILRLNLGYRFMHQYYQTDGNNYKWDMNLFGPVFGISMTI